MHAVSELVRVLVERDALDEAERELELVVRAPRLERGGSFSGRARPAARRSGPLEEGLATCWTAGGDGAGWVCR